MNTQPTKPQQIQQVAVAKYKNGRTEADGPPDEIVILKEQWVDVDGSITSDPARIEDLKREAGA